MSWTIPLPFLDESFPDFDKAFEVVESVLDTYPKSTVHLLVTRSSGCSYHIHKALYHFRTQEGYVAEVVPAIKRDRGDWKTAPSEDEHRVEVLVYKKVVEEE